jgi:hypothetical protein
MNIQDFNYQQTKYGIELRDHFAAKALQGVLAADTEELLSVDAIASVSYRIADAMLKEREK